MSNSMLRPALVTFGALAVITGIVYPLAMTGFGKAIFHRQVSGSLIVENGQVRGSALIGRSTEDPRLFWGRLSATSDSPTNGMASGGTNLAPGNPDLRKAAEARIQALHAADPGNTALIPSDLITASGSGLDPHISPAAAEYQVARVARLRGLDPGAVRHLVQRHTQSPAIGIIGETTVNVLALNLELEKAGH
jgi:potassium-transporting ATPase KdpC subunit